LPSDIVASLIVTKLALRLQTLAADLVLIGFAGVKATASRSLQQCAFLGTVIALSRDTHCTYLRLPRSKI
jgi:hypothetical protein